MKKLFFTLFVFATSVFCCNAYAQKKDSCAHRYVGIGIRSAIFSISELQQSIMPPNRVMLSVDPIKYVRVEGQFGMYSNAKDQYVSSSPAPVMLKMKEGASISGCGLFGVYPIDKVKFLAGFRYMTSAYSKDNFQYSTYGSVPAIVTDKGKITTISGVIGAEYNFSKWFSAGAEFSLLNMNDDFTPANPTSPKINSKTTITESCLVFRFYPY
ncbi:MAG TPA: hypothetical protein VII99_04060 [Bacteroidia bacterium]